MVKTHTSSSVETAIWYTKFRLFARRWSVALMVNGVRIHRMSVRSKERKGRPKRNGKLK